MEVDPITSDGLLLLQRFKQKESVDFVDFVATWNELTFPLIYWNGLGQEQKAEVVELLFAVGVQHVCQPGGIYGKIGGLYLLYSIYFTQPCWPKVLVRVTLSDWETLHLFHEQLKSEKHLDAEYVLCRLKASSAFIICCLNRPRCLNLWSGEPGGVYLNSLQVEEHSHIDAVHEAVEHGVKDYHELKQQLSDYLPQHLLSYPHLPQRMNEYIDSYKISTVQGTNEEL